MENFHGSTVQTVRSAVNLTGEADPCRLDEFAAVVPIAGRLIANPITAVLIHLSYLRREDAAARRIIQ
jgi:hypothetical protein